MRKICVSVLQFDVVMASARGDQDVGCGNRNAGRACSPRHIKRRIPNGLTDREFRQQPLEILQHLFFAIASRSIPQLEAHDRTPTSFPSLECALYPTANDGIALGAEQVDPG